MMMIIIRRDFVLSKSVFVYGGGADVVDGGAEALASLAASSFSSTKKEIKVGKKKNAFDFLTHIVFALLVYSDRLSRPCLKLQVEELQVVKQQLESREVTRFRSESNIHYRSPSTAATFARFECSTMVRVLSRVESLGFHAGDETAQRRGANNVPLVHKVPLL